MKPFCSLVILMIGLCFYPSANAQNPLPDLSVKELTRGKIQISWYSPERNCIQLAVQRSNDSSKNFRTIFSAQSPELITNGFVDNKPIFGKAYYRIFYVVQGGEYFFTRSVMIETQLLPFNDKPLPVMEKSKDLTSIYVKKAMVFRLNKAEYKHFKDSINTKTKDALRRIDETAVEWIPAKTNDKREIVRVYAKDILLLESDRNGYNKFRDSIKTQTRDTLYAIDPIRIQLHPFIPIEMGKYFIYRNDSLLFSLATEDYRRFKDSMSTRTHDTLYATDRNRVEIHSFYPKYMWRPSKYIFTNSRGYVTIELPLVKQHKYHVIFYEEDGTELFRLKTLKDPQLILDKIDFVHAGWFSFELFEDDKLKEKNKILLTKD